MNNVFSLRNVKVEIINTRINQVIEKKIVNVSQCLGNITQNLHVNIKIYKILFTIREN